MTNELEGDKEILFPWFGEITSSAPLEQGDFFNSFPIPTYPPGLALAELPLDTPGATLEAEVPTSIFDVVLITQSCDLLKFRDDSQVLLLPRYGYSNLAAREEKIQGKSGWDALVKERVLGLHLTNRCEIEGNQFDFQVIDLQTVFSVPLGIVKSFAENHSDRIRLLPPYREHLAQAFARQFMRVGLPRDLPREYPKPNSE